MICYFGGWNRKVVGTVYMNASELIKGMPFEAAIIEKSTGQKLIIIPSVIRKLVFTDVNRINIVYQGLIAPGVERIVIDIRRE